MAWVTNLEIHATCSTNKFVNITQSKINVQRLESEEKIKNCKGYGHLEETALHIYQGN